MIKRILPIACLGFILISNSACNSSNDGFKKVNGVEYKILKDVPGPKTNVGDLLKLNVVMKIGDRKSGGDTTLFDTKKQNNNEPVPMQLGPANFRGDWLGALALLSAGDSAIIRVPVDTIQKSINQKAGTPQPLPPFMKHGETIIYEVKVVSVESAADYQKEMMAKQQQAQAGAAQQAQADNNTLLEYFAKNNIKPQKTADGVYYTIQNPGTGDQIKSGQSVTLNYTGKTLSGKTFDSNTDPAFKHQQPFTFTVGGRAGVIKGWDEGIALLKKGSKATLYIPSPLAYGQQSPSPDVPANSILIFDVEVTDVK